MPVWMIATTSDDDSGPRRRLNPGWHRNPGGDPMDVQLWSKAEDKSATILALRGDELHCLEVTGNKARQEAARIMGALQQGQEPSTVGANSSSALKVGSIARAQVCEDNMLVEFHPEGEKVKPLKFSSSDKKGADIIRAVLAGAGRPYREEKQDITAVEAVIPPIIIGVIIGFVWTMVYYSAGEMAAQPDKEIEATGRRRGIKQMFIFIAGMLGVNGTLAVGVVLLAAIVGWATMRVVRRPQRTVWQPELA
jgi:hypothetical protein